LKTLKFSESTNESKTWLRPVAISFNCYEKDDGTYSRAVQHERCRLLDLWPRVGMKIRSGRA
jgi:hypothetical protein